MGCVFLFEQLIIDSNDSHISPFLHNSHIFLLKWRAGVSLVPAELPFYAGSSEGARR